MATVIVICLLGVWAVLALRSMKKRKKSGGCSCGCGGSCGACDGCGKK